jgi:RNA methyltransferase, TrmH family
MTARPAGRHLAATLANPRADRVKQVAALAGRSARRRAGQVLVEGPQAVRELVAHRAASVRDIYVSEDALTSRGPLALIADAALEAGLFVHPATADVVRAMSADCQGIVAVASSDAVDSQLPTSVRLVAILSQVRDPGNAGAAIRVADAAGADAVILAGDSVDPTNPKVVRATAGSLFHLPVTRASSLADAVQAAREAGLTVLAADVSGDAELGTAEGPDLKVPTAWVFGNEAWGLSEDELALADRVVRIPIFGLAESLNLGTAAAVCLYASAMASSR